MRQRTASRMSCSTCRRRLLRLKASMRNRMAAHSMGRRRCRQSRWMMIGMDIPTAPATASHVVTKVIRGDSTGAGGGTIQVAADRRESLESSMPSESSPSDLWNLVSRGQPIDANSLLSAIQQTAETAQPLDYRTRLLMHEGLAALACRWGREALLRRLNGGAAAARMGDLLDARFEETGFPTLGRRLMDATRPETVLQFLRELGERLQAPARIDIGGSTALILAGLLSRATEDIDVVDEAPEPIRSDHALLRSLSERYGLALTQVHQVPPARWWERAKPLGDFGRLEARLVDPVDIFTGKLFSRREKDLDDLRALAPRLDRARIEERVRSSAAGLMAEPGLRQNAARNWRVVYGGELPRVASA